jgi:hypothetical protein
MTKTLTHTAILFEQRINFEGSQDIPQNVGISGPMVQRMALVCLQGLF